MWQRWQLWTSDLLLQRRARYHSTTPRRSISISESVRYLGCVAWRWIELVGSYSKIFVAIAKVWQYVGSHTWLSECSCTGLRTPFLAAFFVCNFWVCRKSMKSAFSFSFLSFARWNVTNPKRNRPFQSYSMFDKIENKFKSLNLF